MESFVQDGTQKEGGLNTDHEIEPDRNLSKSKVIIESNLLTHFCIFRKDDSRNKAHDPYSKHTSGEKSGMKNSST